LLSDKTRNDELEEKLREAEKCCHSYEMKNKSQHGLIVDLTDAIHSMASSSSDVNDTKIPEEMSLLLTKNALRISELCEEVARMKIELLKQAKDRKYEENNGDEDIYSHSDSDDEEDDNDDDDEDDYRFDDVSLDDKEKESLSFEVEEEKNALEEEYVRVSSKCESLERSLETLKRKNSEREIRSMRSLRNMRRQIDSLEQERKRRLDLQASAEDRALQLEIEVHQLKQKLAREDASGHQQLTKDQRLETEFDGNKRARNHYEFDPSAAKGLNKCRKFVMMRNQLMRVTDVSSPPKLVAVSEESDDSEDSEDDFRPSFDSYSTL
jgi:hypothetical protein